MTTETETVVTEQPATHNKKAQLWLFALLGAVLFFLVLDVIVKLTREPTQLSKRKNDEPALTNVAAPQDSEAEFLRRLQQEDERRAREAGQGEKPTETPSQALERLRAEREAAAQIAELPPAERAEAREQMAAARAGGAAGAKVQKTPAEQWAEKEELRVLNSRFSSLKVRLADTRGAGAGTPRNPAARTTAAAPSRVTATGTPLAQEQASVKAQLERMEALKKRIESGEANPEDIASEMGATFQRTALTSDTSAEPAGSNQPARAAQRGPGQVVGKPSAAAGPEPGQKQISVGTVARAVLDQLVMSDYEGPFRGMIVDDVYDVTNRFIIIPKGARVVGETARIRNVNEPIQARMALLVNWIVLPDGSKISMDKKIALDAEGVAAIKDKVNRHFLAQFLGVAAYAVLSSETSREGTGLGVDRTFESDVGEGFRDQFAPLARKYLDLVPTITLRPGTPMRIFFEDDIYAHPWSTVSGDIVSQARVSDAR